MRRKGKFFGYRQDTGFRVAMRECEYAGPPPKPMPAEEKLKCAGRKNGRRYAENFVRAATIRTTHVDGRVHRTTFEDNACYSTY